jgi:HD superfamily phosphohydrolase YqeK
VSGLHPVLARAAGGTLPAWAVVHAGRKAHLASVAACLDRWARALGLPDEERARWRAAGYLHDALRDADAAEFGATVAPEWPPALRHGPAVAARLRADGVQDEELLRAVAYHTVGHPEFGMLGRFLYLADFLEPGRPQRADWRAALRARLPEREREVLLEVAAARIGRTLQKGGPLLWETVEFWNRSVRWG